MSRQSFYQKHLDQVSRSFAFCIAELRQPLREWIGLAYILCRVADTVEDAAWTVRQDQLDSLAELKRLVQNDYSAAELEAWCRAIPTTIPDHEKALLRDADQFFQDLKSLPPAAHRAILGTLLNMIDGMAHFCARAPAQEHLRLNDDTSVNQYCFFVAGIVGELLTGLVLADTPEFKPDETIWIDAIHFGLFLQKINILKDQIGDEAEGRFLIHSREAFKASLVENAQGAIRYLTSIPGARRDYRIFCGWSLFLGLGSLPWIEKAWRDKSGVKISRTESGLLLARVRLKIDDNDALRELFSEFLPGADQARSIPQIAAGPAPAWLHTAYRGKITDADFNSLKMV